MMDMVKGVADEGMKGWSFCGTKGALYTTGRWRKGGEMGLLSTARIISGSLREGDEPLRASNGCRYMRGFRIKHHFLLDLPSCPIIWVGPINMCCRCCSSY